MNIFWSIGFILFGAALGFGACLLLLHVMGEAR